MFPVERLLSINSLLFVPLNLIRILQDILGNAAVRRRHRSAEIRDGLTVALV